MLSNREAFLANKDVGVSDLLESDLTVKTVFQKLNLQQVECKKCQLVEDTTFQDSKNIVRKRKLVISLQSSF